MKWFGKIVLGLILIAKRICVNKWQDLAPYWYAILDSKLYLYMIPVYIKWFMIYDLWFFKK